MNFTYYRSKVFLSQSGLYRWSGEAMELSCTMRMQDHTASVPPLKMESPSMWVIIFKWDILISSLPHPGLQNTQKEEMERMKSHKWEVLGNARTFEYGLAIAHINSQRWGYAHIAETSKNSRKDCRGAHEVPLLAEQWLTMENWWERENHSSLR